MRYGIGIDIDDTLTNLFDIFVSYGFKYAHENNIVIDELFVNGYEAIDTFNFSKKQDKEFQEKYLNDILTSVKARPLASEVIKKLKEKYDIYIITSRNDELLEDCKKKTEKWLKDNEIPYDYFIYDCSNKADFCKQHNIKYMIDDNYKHCYGATKCGVKGFIFDNSFNRDYYNNKVTRVYSWGQVLYEIEKDN